MPELRLLWFDGEGFTTEEQSFRFYKLVYNANPNVLVNRRVGWNFGDYLDSGDNKIPSANEKLNKYGKPVVLPIILGDIKCMIKIGKAPESCCIIL